MKRSTLVSPVREHVLATLGDTPGALTIDEVAAAMPPKRTKVLRPCGDRCPAPLLADVPNRRVVEHHSDWHVIESPYRAADIYRVLRALEHDGKVRSMGRIGGPICWSLSAVGAMDRLGWLVVDAKPKEVYL